MSLPAQRVTFQDARITDIFDDTMQSNYYPGRVRSTYILSVHFTKLLMKVKDVLPLPQRLNAEISCGKDHGMTHVDSDSTDKCDPEEVLLTKDDSYFYHKSKTNNLVTTCCHSIPSQSLLRQSYIRCSRNSKQETMCSMFFHQVSQS